MVHVVEEVGSVIPMMLRATDVVVDLTSAEGEDLESQLAFPNQLLRTQAKVIGMLLKPGRSVSLLQLNLLGSPQIYRL